jgi:hypothetical protein
MEIPMLIMRWLPTFLGFPLGGWLAVLTVGSIDGPVTAALAGVLAGAVIGAAQWLALPSRGIGLRWVIHTAVGMAAGSALAAAVTGAATTVSGLMLSGLISGAAVGAAQAPLLGRGRRVAAVWTTVVSAAWALGWLITSMVIVDAERGYISFGSSGALVVTVLTGLALHVVLGGRRDGEQQATQGTAAAPATTP